MNIKYILITLFIGFQGLVQAQDDGFIYGRITTIDGNQYKGALRWGSEEAYWHDLFNATKIGNSNLKHLSRSDYKDNEGDWRDLDWKIFSIWSDEYSKVTHQFVCRFGDLRAIEVTGREKLTVTLKDGSTMKLSGGSNDVGATIRVADDEIGELSIKWARIEKIEFMNTPSRLKKKFGEPLYGEVKTLRNGVFKGFIQWDHDERISTDELNGVTPDGRVDIPFGNIKVITQDGNRCRITLNSGREFPISGSNDVDRGNRGVIVFMDKVGSVDIPWRQFNSIEFFDNKGSGDSYKNYPAPKVLKGRVTLVNDDILSGTIIFDLDETLDIELIQGEDNDLEYEIPIRNIKKVTPRNYEYSMVDLRKGNNILMGNARDVSDSNAGLLVFENGKEKPTYVSWNKVREILFD